jgi:protein disulfide-isomerase
MRQILFITTILFALAMPIFADSYPPEGWTASITDAISQAEREDKMIMLDFTGSDWCGWCHKLENEVWNTSEFETWADDNVVKVFLDFPQGIDLTTEQKQQNGLLQQVFGVQGYPTVFLLDSDLTPLLKTGYREGGADEYIRHLSSDRPRMMESPEEFGDYFRGIIEEYIGPIS